MHLASWTAALTFICFKGCSGVSLGSVMSSTKSMQQRYSSSNPGEESSSTCAGVAGRDTQSFLSLHQWEKGAGPEHAYLGTVSRVTVCRDGLSTSV